MKILQIGKFYPIRGGVEKVMYDIMQGVSQQYIHCDMLCAATENQAPGTIQLNEYARVLCMPTMIKLAATMISPAMIFRLRKMCRQYDVIHIHHPDPMACLALFCSGYKGYVILHWHSDILKQKTLLKLYSPLQNWLIRRAEIIVGTTPVYINESPFLQSVQHKVASIPIGIDEVKFDSQEVKRIRAQYPGKKIIFSLGRLVEYKGYEYLIRAARTLSNDCMILIGGKGPLETNLQTLIGELGVEDKVKLIGFINDCELPNYFGACDLFCLSSIWKTEAFAIVQLEAMSCGKPIVATRIPESGVSWVNADGLSGRNVSPQNPEELTKVISTILTDREEYERLSAGARQRYETMFTKKLMIDRCVNLYNLVLEKEA